MPILSARGGASARAYGWGALSIANAGWEAIASITPSGVTTASISSIPATYGTLVVHFDCKFSSNSSLDVQINGQTTNTYRTFVLYPGSSASGNYYAPYTAIRIGGNYSITTNVNSLGGAIYMVDYANTSKIRSALTMYGTAGDTTTPESGICASYIDLSSAINSITFNSSSGVNFASGSRISVYGVANA